jgi:HK97 family phage major capsid protein
MTTEYVELNAKMDEALRAIKTAQDVAEHNKVDKEQIAKISKDASEALLAVQEINQKTKALEETNKVLEKLVLRMPQGKDGINEMDQKARDEFTRYLRKHEPISQETIDGICDDLAKKMYSGLNEAEMLHHKNQLKSLQVGIDPQGGYFVRPQLLTQMITRIFETSPIRLVANVVTTASDGVEMIIDDNEVSTGGWVGETSTRDTTNTANIGKLTIEAHEQYVKPQATQKMLDDSGFDIESWLMKKITDKMSRVENTAFVVGDGSQKPKGFLSYDAWATNSTPSVQGVYQRGALEQVNSGAAGLFTADGIKLLKNSLIEDYQANAVFLIQRASFEPIITLKDGIGDYMLKVDSLKTGDDLILLGKRVIFAADMPNIAVNSLSLIYGDFSLGYTIVDRLGFRVLRDPYSNKPFIQYYTTKRTGGAVTNYQSLKIQKLAV